MKLKNCIFTLVVMLSSFSSTVFAESVAKIGDTEYATLADAITNAEANATITLLSDIEASVIITIDKSITIDGNGKTLTYTGNGASARAIDVPANADAEVNVTIENLTVDCTASYCQRGINYNEDGALTLNKVTVKGTNVTYALNLPGSSDNCEVTITDSDLSGNIALNVWGENSTINATNTTFTAVDNNTAEGYAAVKLNNDGETSAEGTEINITGGKIDVTGSAAEDTEAVSNGTSTGTINISDATVVNGEVATMVAVIRYADGNSYSFTKLEDAIAKATAEDVITMLRDVEASEIITINKSITIDGNGKTLRATDCEFPIVVSQSAEVNVENCNLTYTREFAAVDTWYALYVPFTVELTDDFLSKYDVAEFSEMTTESMTITMVEEDKLAANTPYFILVKDEASIKLEITVDGAEFEASSTNLGNVATLNGVYTETEASTIADAYAMSSGAFRQAADENQILKPFRFYLMFNEPSQAAALRTISINVDGEEGTTAIDNSIFTNGETVVYDLQGRRVENPAKGIYIVNGKKVVIK